MLLNGRYYYVSFVSLTYVKILKQAAKRMSRKITELRLNIKGNMN